MKDALVIVDVQRGMFTIPNLPPFDGEAAVNRMAAMLERARASDTPVFFVQHDGGPGDILSAEGPGFAFHPLLMPAANDSVTIKRFGNAFKHTDLHARLRDARIERLTVCGLQSEYCVDAFVRAGNERGYAVRLAADGHTTFDTEVLPAPKIIAHENLTLSGSYAEVLPCCELIV